MKKFFYYLWQCIRNISFYKDTVIKETFGGTFKYLLGMMLLLSLIFTFVVTIGMNVEFNAAYNEFYNEVDPDFHVTMDNGSLTMKVKQPYIYYDKNFAFIVDTTGLPHDLPEFQEGLLIKRWDAVFKNDGKKYDINYRQQEIDDFSLNKEQAFNVLAIIKRVALIVLPGFIFLGAFVVSYIGKIIYFAFIALFTWLIAAIMKVADINYQKAFTLTVFAATAPVIARDLLGHMGVTSFIIWWLYYITLTIYIVKAYREIRE